MNLLIVPVCSCTGVECAAELKDLSAFFEGGSTCRVVFESFLCPVKLIINSFFKQQFFVCSGFPDEAVIHHIDAVGLCYIAQTMGNEKNGLSLCQFPYDIHNVLFAGSVDVAGCFVEDQDFRVFQKCSGDCKSLCFTC